MGDIVVAVNFLSLKNQGAIHWDNLGDWGEFSYLKRKATKICMLKESIAKILYMKVSFH